MDWKKHISVVALVVSIISFALSYHLSRQAAITSVRPVLVFHFNMDRGWYIKNVGNGPALDVLVASKPPGNTVWKSPTRIRPIPKSGEYFIQKWLNSNENANPSTLGMTYLDIKQRAYTTTYEKGVSTILEGNRLGDWPDSEIQRFWW